MKKVITLLSILMICIPLYSQKFANLYRILNLNSIFSKYSHTIKTNSPFSSDNTNCIYNANYMNVEQQDNILILNFGFGWDKQYGYIQKCSLSINLSTATFCTGQWKNLDDRWEQFGPKEEITIKDSNGMDLTSIGQQNYNQGTKQDLIHELKIGFGSEPLANRVLNELYTIQSQYKSKETWLLSKPEPEPKKVEPHPSSQKKVASEPTGSKKAKLSNNTKETTVKKYGKYGQ